MKAHVQTVQNMYGKGGGLFKAEFKAEVDPRFGICRDAVAV